LDAENESIELLIANGIEGAECGAAESAQLRVFRRRAPRAFCALRCVFLGAQHEAVVMCFPLSAHQWGSWIVHLRSTTDTHNTTTNPHQFVRQLLAPERNNTLVAAARRVSPELQRLADAHPGRLVLTDLDVADEASIKAWAGGVKKQVSESLFVAAAAALANARARTRNPLHAKHHTQHLILDISKKPSHTTTKTRSARSTF
jgi:hypothetical protein